MSYLLYFFFLWPNILIVEPFSAARTGPCLGDNDLEDIPSSSRVSAKDKKKMVNEMLKCTPDEYEQSLRGYNEAHVTPIMTLLAEVTTLVFPGILLNLFVYLQRLTLVLVAGTR